MPTSRRRSRTLLFSDCRFLLHHYIQGISDNCSFNLKEWCEEVVKEIEQGKLRSGTKDNFWDQVFENEMNQLIKETKENYARYVPSHSLHQTR